MSDERLKTLGALGTKSVSRRGFLRGGAIAAAIVGASAALPAALHGQQRSQDPQEKKDPKKPDPDESASDNNDNSGDGETKTDAEGREYRVCPQCGSNMYRQGRTWTCENCGYSYVE